MSPSRTSYNIHIPRVRLERILLILVMISTIYLIANSVNISKGISVRPQSSSTQTNNNFPSNRTEVASLVYLIEFEPSFGNVYATNYSVKIMNGDFKIANYSFDFNDLGLTYAEADYSYNVSYETNKIFAVNNTNLNGFMVNSHSEIFMNTSNITGQNIQTFRVDEMITFAEYLKPSGVALPIYPQDLNFNYTGLANYSRNLFNSIDCYKFSAKNSWIGAGCS
ncbi:MAG: hypothetical protein ACTSU2_00820 [Promethearchaeota archaeon]